MRVVGLTFLVLFVGIFNSCSKESKNNIGGARVVEQSDPPKIIDVQLRENGRESSIELLVSFDEVVIVRSTEGPTAQTTDQTPRISFFFKSDLEQTLRFAKYHSGSGSNMLIFRYRYESQEGIDIRDIQVSSEIDLNGGKIADYEEKKEATLVLKSPQDSTIPSPPSLRLISPSSSTSSNPAPRFIVSQVEEESRVRLYSDDTCTVSISEEVVVSEGETSVEVTSSILDSDRTITYYARQTDSNGNTSSCSSSSVSYTYDTTAPDMPFSLVLKNPISSISNIDTPEITVSGLISGLEPGAVVRLYRDSGCQNEISSPEQVGLGQISVDIVSNRLTRDDTYTYYANQTDEAGNVSSCSIAFASYTYDSTAPSVPNRLVLYNTPTSGNNPSPEITVFGIEENATIQLFRDGRCQSEMSSIVRSKKGQTSIRIKSAHLSHNGNYIYFARQTDEAGNVSNCSFASIIYIFDNTPPSVPTALSLSSPNSSPGNDPTPEIRVSGLALGARVQLYSDSDCRNAISSPVTVRLRETSLVLESRSLNEGRYIYYADQIDAAGNRSSCSSASVSYRYDNTNPGAPAGLALHNITTPGNNSRPEITVSGVEGGAIVQLFTDNNCQTEGSASVRVPFDDSSINIPANLLNEDRVYKFYAKQTDRAGNLSVCSTATVSYKYDGTAPVPPTSLALSSLTSPGKIAVPRIMVSGVVNRARVQLYSDNDCSTPASSEVMVRSGSTVIIRSNPLRENGIYHYYATQTDPVGNTSTCSSAKISYTYDNVITPPSGLSLSSPGRSPGNDATPDITVSGVETGARVGLYSDSNCQVSISNKATVQSGSSVTISSNSLTENSQNTFYAKQVDAAGNISSCSSERVSYLYDGTVNPPAGLALNSPNSSPGNDSTPEVMVSGVEIGARVQLYSDNTCTTSVSNKALAQSGTTVLVTTHSLTEGTSYTFHAKQTDKAGNISNCSSLAVSYTYDNTAPASPTSLALHNIVTPGNNANPEITVSGVELNAKVRLYSDHNCQRSISDEVTVSSGSTVVIQSKSLNRNGLRHYYAKQTDHAGNASACSSAKVSYTYDDIVTAPSRLSLNSPGRSPGNNATPEIMVSGVENGAKVRLYKDNNCQTSISNEVTVSSGSSVMISSNTLTQDSRETFYAKQTDAAGNISNCSIANVSYRYDGVVNPPTGLALRTPESSPGNDSTPKIVVLGVETGARVQLYSDNSCTTSASGEIIVQSGTKAVLTTNPLTDGTSYTFYAKQTDKAGNVSTCSSLALSYTYDDTVPASPTSLALHNIVTPGNNANPEITVSGVELNARVRLYSDSGCKIEMSDVGEVTSGTTITLRTNPLRHGSYNFYAKQTDAAKNSSDCSSTYVSYTYDNFAPHSPTRLALHNLTSPGNNASPSIVVSGIETGARVQLYSDGSCRSSISGEERNSSGTTVTITANALTGGQTYTFHAKQIDTAGNSSSCSIAFIDYTYDNTAAAPTRLALHNTVSPSNDATPEVLVSGVEKNARVQIYSDNACTTDVSSEVIVQSGTAVVITVNTLNGGTYTFYAKQTDAAGNESVCSSANVAYNYDNTLTPPRPIACFVINGTTVSGYRSYDEGGNPCPRDVVIPDGINTIAANAFQRKGLTSVTIPSNVTTIGDYAFSHNHLTRVTIPDSITTMGNYVFANNTAPSIYIASGLDTVGSYAFANGALKEIALSENITTIGNYAFSGNRLADMSIPDTITTIGNHAFSDNLLTEVFIPESVTSIGENAFAGNKLLEVSLSEGLTSIGDSAFYENDLKRVFIPDSVTSIGENAFKKNDNLSLACVHGENSGRTFHDDAFPDHIIRYGCPQETPLSCFGIDGSLQGDMTARYYKYDNIRRLCPSEIVVPGVPIIGERSFSGLGLTRAIIPKTVTSIEKYSFSQNSLTDIILPQGLTGISGGAFFENKLTSVTIPEKVEIIGGLKDGSSLRCSFHEGHSRDHTYGAFANNYLTRLTIPGSVKRICPMSFQNNSLTNLTIPNGVTNIGERAFENNSLTNLTIPNSVTNIGDYAFTKNPLPSTICIEGINRGMAPFRVGRDYNRNEIKIPIFPLGTSLRFQEDCSSPPPSTNPLSCFNITDYTLKNYNDFDGYGVACARDVKIPNNIIKIKESAFRNKRLTSVTIPISVISIGNTAFSDNSLTSVIIPNSVAVIGRESFKGNSLTSVTISNRLGLISQEAFAGNSLTSVIIPDSVGRIGQQAFEGNDLINVTLSDSVTTIGQSAFKDNELTSLIIPNSVTSIQGSAFKNNALANLVLSNSVTLIGTSAFESNSLTSVTIPDSVTSIYANAFRYNSIESLVIPSNVTSIGGNAFTDNPLTSVCVEGSSLSRSFYSNAFPTGINPVFQRDCSTPPPTLIPSSCFTRSGSVLTGYQAFDSKGYSCSLNVTIPNGIVQIGNNSYFPFRNMGLKSVVIPNSVTSIGGNAFANNDLTSVVIPNSVTSIRGNAFAGNPLTTVCIEGASRTFDSNAFPSTATVAFKTSCP